MTTQAWRRAGRLELRVRGTVPCGSAADRTAPRYRTFLAGKLHLDDGAMVLCVVRDMSKTGARLVIDPAARLSGDVELHVLSRNEIFCGQIVWREGDTAGLRFTAWRKM